MLKPPPRDRGNTRATVHEAVKPKAGVWRLLPSQTLPFSQTAGKMLGSKPRAGGSGLPPTHPTAPRGDRSTADRETLFYLEETRPSTSPEVSTLEENLSVG